MANLKGPLKKRFNTVKWILNDIGKSNNPGDHHYRSKAVINWWTSSSGEVVLQSTKLFEFYSKEELVEWVEMQATCPSSHYGA